MSDDPLILWRQLGKAGWRALRHDPSIDEFTALLAQTADRWKTDLSRWAGLADALCWALESQPQVRVRRGPYERTLKQLETQIAAEHALRSQLEPAAVEAVGLLASGCTAGSSSALWLEEAKRIEARLQAECQAFWNAALILLLRRWEAVLEGRRGRVSMAWPDSLLFQHPSSSEDETWYDAWVDVELPVTEGEGAKHDQRRTMGSDYFVRVLGFGVAPEETEPKSNTCLRCASLLLQPGTILQAGFQVSDGQQLVPAPHAIQPPPEQRIAPTGLWHRVKSAIRRAPGRRTEEAQHSIVRPRYLRVGEGQACRLVLKAQRPFSSAASEPIVWIRGHYVLQRRRNVPRGYVVASEHGVPLRSRGFLIIRARYRDGSGPSWTEPSLCIPIEIVHS